MPLWRGPDRATSRKPSRGGRIPTVRWSVKPGSSVSATPILPGQLSQSSTPNSMCARCKFTDLEQSHARKVATLLYPVRRRLRRPSSPTATKRIPGSTFCHRFYVCPSPPFGGQRRHLAKLIPMADVPATRSHGRLASSCLTDHDGFIRVSTATPWPPRLMNRQADVELNRLEREISARQAALPVETHSIPHRRRAPMATGCVSQSSTRSSDSCSTSSRAGSAPSTMPRLRATSAECHVAP